MNPVRRRSHPPAGWGVRRVVVLAALLVAAQSALLAPGASAHIGTIGSQHALNLDAGFISGQLTSAESDCLSGRRATLYRVGAAGDTAVSSTLTDSAGAWTRSASDLQAGDYYATAAAKLVKRPGHKHNCSSATSNTVTIPDAEADDADGDGYTTGLGDCDDTNPAVSPGAAEVVNGIDDDCDGSIDEGFETTPNTCWAPSSEPVTATTTWSQVEITQPCTWQLRTFWNVLPDSVFMVSNDWMIEYRPAAVGDPAAFEYAGKLWIYHATHPNCCFSGD